MDDTNKKGQGNTSGGANLSQESGLKTNATPNSAKANATTFEGQNFDVLGIERRGDKLALQVRGEVVLSATDKERDKFLNMESGSRVDVKVSDVKPAK